MSLGVVLVSAELCSDGLRLPSVTRTSFSGSGHHGRERVYRRRRERYMDACVRQVDMWGGSSTMVWAAISADHRSDLVFINGNLNAVLYRDEILGPVVLPFFERV